MMTSDERQSIRDDLLACHPHDVPTYGSECAVALNAALDALDAKDAEIDRLKLRWTTALPTVNGWYWQRRNTKAPRPYDVFDVRIRDGVAEIFVIDEWDTIDKATGGFPGEWAGPIPEPE